MEPVIPPDWRGTTDEYRVAIERGEVRAFTALDVADRKMVARLRTERERRIAMAIGQPQGLGLLFAGLRPKGER